MTHEELKKVLKDMVGDKMNTTLEQLHQRIADSESSDTRQPYKPSANDKKLMSIVAADSVGAVIEEAVRDIDNIVNHAVRRAISKKAQWLECENILDFMSYVETFIM